MDHARVLKIVLPFSIYLRYIVTVSKVYKYKDGRLCRTCRKEYIHEKVRDRG